MFWFKTIKEYEIDKRMLMNDIMTLRHKIIELQKEFEDVKTKAIKAISKNNI